MENDTKALRLTEEGALHSQVLEIIGGITPAALQSPEEPEERHMWTTEEGDDSVFYSDEDQDNLDIKANGGASACKRLVNSVAADEEESFFGEEIEGLVGEVTEQAILTEQDDKKQELQTPNTEAMDHLDPADPGAKSNLSPEKSAGTCVGSLKCTTANEPIQKNISAEKVEKEELPPSVEPFDGTNESYTELNGEADVPMQNAEQQISGDRELQLLHNIHVPVELHQNPSPGYATLPQPKKSCGGGSGHQKSFNHLSSSKYSTVSYRKIRRGNTREKIEEFEYMIMNL